MPSFPAFADATRALLDARAGLDGVGTWTAEPGDAIGTEAIVFLGAEVTEGYAALGTGVREEDYFVRGYCRAHKRGQPTEATFKAARDRAYVIYAELEAQLRADPTSGAVVHWSDIASGDCRQGTDTEGRWCEVTFRIHVKTWF